MAQIIVIGLLTWAASDLLFPRLCAEDFAATTQSAGQADNGARQQDDCFCCCHHLVPAHPDVAMVVVLAVHAGAIATVNPLFGTARPVFHPPLSI